jgi:two-component system, LytTR family, sensor kinase
MKDLWTIFCIRLDNFKAYLQQSKWNIILVHFIIWVILMLYEGVFVYKVAREHIVPFAYMIPSYILFATYVYVHALVLLPKFLERRKYGSYLLSLLLLTFVLIYIKYIVRFYLMPILGVNDFGGAFLLRMSLKWFVAAQITYMGHYFLYGIGYWYALRAVRLEKHKRRLEREVLKAQADYLRFQINPHFLYNVLNFFYGQIQPISKPLADGILQLSEMMRYAISNEDGDQKVDLDKEISHLRNFIEVQQLRFNNTCQIDFKVEGNIFAKRILPLVLITYIENVFKHGELFEANNPAVIHIKIVQSEMTLYVRNKKRIGIKDPSSGIGTANIINRLKLFYKDRYKYDVFEDDIFYSSILIIQL